MSDPTFSPSVEQHLGRLSRTAEEMRAQLLLVEAELDRSGISLPRGVLEGLRQLSGTLSSLQDSVKESEKERRNLVALAELGQVINSSLDLDTVLNKVIDTLIRLTGAQRAFLMLREDDGGMETVVARNWEQESLESGAHEVSRTIVRQVLQRGEAVLTTNAKEDPRFDGQESIVAYDLRSILCVPLKVKGKLTGVIYADNRIKEGLFTERERSLVSAFANQAAVALENARLFESVRRSLAEVTELKTLMEDVFASITSGVITSDEEGTVTLINQPAQEILRANEEDVIGEPVDLLFLPLEKTLMDHVEQVLEQDEPVLGLEVGGDLPGRGPVQLNLSLSPLKSAEGETRGAAIVIEDLTEKRRMEAQQRLFERMVSPAVIHQLDPDSLQLGGQLTEITTVFADIRGYTAFSESTGAEELVQVLNRYLAAAAEALLAEDATIDKFQGDAVMAWFNAPVRQEDHIQRAVRAAWNIRDAVEMLYDELPEEFHLGFGIGVQVGEALLGLVGTRQRLDYTAVGDCVNTAKRLQEHARAGQILLSQQVVDRLDNSVAVEPIPPLRVEGKSQPLQAYELVSVRESSPSP